MEDETQNAFKGETQNALQDKSRQPTTFAKKSEAEQVHLLHSALYLNACR